MRTRLTPKGRVIRRFLLKTCALLMLAGGITYGVIIAPQYIGQPIANWWNGDDRIRHPETSFIPERTAPVRFVNPAGAAQPDRSIDPLDVPRELFGHQNAQTQTRQVPPSSPTLHVEIKPIPIEKLTKNSLQPSAAIPMPVMTGLPLSSNPSQPYRYPPRNDNPEYHYPPPPNDGH